MKIGPEEIHRILPFTPHTLEDILDFEKKWGEILSNDLELRYPNRHSNQNNNPLLPQDYENSQIHKLSKRISIKFHPNLTRYLYCVYFARFHLLLSKRYLMTLNMNPVQNYFQEMPY